MLKMDLHIHSQYSEDATGSPREIAKLLQKKGLHGMAITDHNSIKGSLEALRFRSNNFVIVPGLEISTNDGHLLALGIKEDVAKNLSVEETVEKILDKGGFLLFKRVYFILVLGFGVPAHKTFWRNYGEVGGT